MMYLSSLQRSMLLTMIIVYLAVKRLVNVTTPQDDVFLAKTYLPCFVSYDRGQCFVGYLSLRMFN